MSAPGRWLGSIVAVNGSPTGPYMPGPSSSFRYDILVTRGRASTMIRGVVPQERRWDDSIKMWPLTPPDVVDVYEIGGKLYMKDAERVPFVEGCNK